MNRLALRNPFAVLAAVLALALLGLAVYPRIPADILPDFKKPVIMSFFSYPGLPTQEMEGSVTSRVERALTLAGDRERIESRTLPGASMLKVTFNAGADPSTAMNDIFNYELSDMFHLPPGIEFPFTLRSEPANLPVMLGAISGEGLDEMELHTIGYYAVRNKMGGLQGVQIPHPFGGKFKQVMTYIDPAKLEAHNLAFTDVVDALRDANVVLAGGTMQVGQIDYQLHPINTLETMQDIDEVVVAERDGQFIQIKDLGKTVTDAALQYNIVRVNGVRSVYVPILREPGENTIQVVDRVREGIAKEIPAMKQRGEIPEAVQVDLVSDQSAYIRKAIAGLQLTVGIGALLVVGVVILFLRRLRPAIAILIMLPLALLTGILGFYFTGETINVMTLGGLALAIGTVVDAGIVVVENIVRHRAMGKDAITAATEGTEEVSLPVLAGTLTTLVVFVPAIFLTGMIRFLFIPLSLAAVITIAASYIIAMTVAPAFCARFLGKQEKGTVPSSEELDESVPEGSFARLLRKVVRGGLLSVAAIVGAGAACFLLVPTLGSELFPDVDAGTFEVRLKTIPGSKLERTEEVVKRLESSIKETIGEKHIETIIANIGLPVGKGAGFSTILSSNAGPDTAYLIVNLTSEGRSRGTMSYVEELRAKWKTDFPDEKFLFVTGGIVNAALNEGSPAPIDIEIKMKDLEIGRQAAETIIAAVKDVPGAADVQLAQAQDLPQLDIKVDRLKAARYGLSQDDVAKTVLSAYGASTGYTQLIWIDPASGKDFFMGVQLGDNRAESLEELRNLPLRIETESGPSTIPLSHIAELKRVLIPGEIAHADIGRVNNVYVNIEGRDLGSVVKDVEKRLAEIELPDGVTVSLQGPVLTMREGSEEIGLGLIIATVLVFLILMAQFKSITDPLIILLAVPLALAGAVLALFITNTTLNIQSLMGCLMLIGVVVNNSILLVGFANSELHSGKSPVDAAVAAARVRARPILMTSLTLVASMAPFAFQLLPGNEAMIPLARAVIGGMIVSTVLTLFLVPAVFALVKRSPTAPQPA
ncbi:efflux RND transporter permease subunit [Haloferula chungangensis]|uniref:Efflux RND transporter permease subunit n=1 Tax=Haloferula chungangensis TaxID=1048331 RepID=A0ABW2LEL6_9BACT